MPCFPPVASTLIGKTRSCQQPVGKKRTEHNVRPRRRKTRVVLVMQLRQLLMERGMTAKELALKARISVGYISDILLGRIEMPGTSHLLRIAEALEVPVAQLIGPDDSMPGPTVVIEQAVNIGIVGDGIFRELLPLDGYPRMSGPRNERYPDAPILAVQVPDTGMDGCRDGPILPGMWVFATSMVDAKLMVESDRLYLVRENDAKTGSKWAFSVRRATVQPDVTILENETTEARLVMQTIVPTPMAVEAATVPVSRGVFPVAVGLVYFYGTFV